QFLPLSDQSRCHSVLLLQQSHSSSQMTLEGGQRLHSLCLGDLLDLGECPALGEHDRHDGEGDPILLRLDVQTHQFIHFVQLGMDVQPVVGS
ncbi:hypothetical protein PMAYCL1PPCAC_05997, partial [Pristionchus mayeri]